MSPIVRAVLNRLLGDQGEREAARFLRRRGLRILVRNYRTPQGEIDLIARDGATPVFVEVKSRRRGTPAEAVTPEKQRKLTLAALHFLKRHGDRKSTRLNSSHANISYAAFCLKTLIPL